MSVHQDSGNLASETAGATFGGLIGVWASAAIPGSDGAAIGSVVGAGSVPVMERWFARIRNEWSRRGAIIVQAAASRAEIGPEQLVERLLEADELQPLVARILDAAARTNSATNLQILGTVLGEALSDRPRQIDDYLLIATAVNDLTPAHLRILEVLERPADPDRDEVGWIAQTIEESIKDVSLLGIQAALGGLVRHGLVRTGVGYGPLIYSLNEFGQALLDVVRLIQDPGMQGTRLRTTNGD
jgi:hypothetical protein